MKYKQNLNEYLERDSKSIHCLKEILTVPYTHTNTHAIKQPRADNAQIQQSITYKDSALPKSPLIKLQSHPTEHFTISKASESIYKLQYSARKCATSLYFINYPILVTSQ